MSVGKFCRVHVKYIIANAGAGINIVVFEVTLKPKIIALLQFESVREPPEATIRRDNSSYGFVRNYLWIPMQHTSRFFASFR